ncbi:MAG: hypothetical protein AAGG47_03240 [Pseudomonadota bacterium]
MFGLKPSQVRGPRLQSAAIIAIGAALGLALPAFADGPIDGLWEGASTAGDAEIGVKASLVDTLGEIKLQGSGRAFGGTVRCRYLLRLQDGAIAETIVSPNLSSPDCPRTPTITLGALEGDQLSVEIDADSLPELPATVLRRRFGPVPEEMRPAVAEGIDVLGARLGDTRAEIEALLVEELGYAPQADRNRRLDDPGYVAEFVHYGRASEHKGSRVADDLVVVAYSGGADSDTAASPEARAVSIRRKWVTHPEARISIEALDDAVAQKYGPGDVTRFFDRSGERVDGMTKAGRLLTRPRTYCRQEMEDTGRQAGVYEQLISIPGEPARFETGVFTHCGSFVSAITTERHSSVTGLSHPVLDLHVARYDLLSDEVWKQISARLLRDLAEDLAREGQSTEQVKPRL